MLEYTTPNFNKRKMQVLVSIVMILHICLNVRGSTG